MRLWSLHPAHLDRAGLVAGWREALLAQAVLADRTTGYRNHPQLVRFRASREPLNTIGSFLLGLHAEACARGYSFDGAKILAPDSAGAPLTVTDGQLEFEWGHLGTKLARRSPEDAARWANAEPSPHPLFQVVTGAVADWERP